MFSHAEVAFPQGGEVGGRNHLILIRRGEESRPPLPDRHGQTEETAVVAPLPCSL